MKTTTKIMLAGGYVAFSAFCAATAFAGGGQGYSSKYNKDRDPSTFSEEERAAMVQEKRSLKKKYTTKRYPITTPTSPSNPHEAAIQRKAAADKAAEESKDTAAE